MEHSMDNEIKITDNEFHDTVELHESEESLVGNGSEFLETDNEVKEYEEEFYELRNLVHGAKADSDKKAKRKKQHEKLVRKMSYLVASTVAVVVLSNTLGNSIGSNVNKAGGNTRGDLRFSIQWNDRNNNKDDLDAHCLEPEGYEIFYGNAGVMSPAGGCLDVDIVQPGENVAVENIIYESRKDMKDGTYQLFVHCFAEREGNSGFSAEVEIRGRVYEFKHSRKMEQGEIVVVAEVILENGKFRLKDSNAKSVSTIPVTEAEETQQPEVAQEELQQPEVAQEAEGSQESQQEEIQEFLIWYDGDKNLTDLYWKWESESEWKVVWENRIIEPGTGSDFDGTYKEEAFMVKMAFDDGEVGEATLSVEDVKKSKEDAVNMDGYLVYYIYPVGIWW